MYKRQTNGDLDFNSDGTYTYTPNANFNGNDSFVYTVTDADSGESATQTVAITVTSVNDLPVAVAESFSTDEDTPLTGDVSTNDTLSGDGGNAYSIEAGDGPSNGTVNLNATDGTFTYTPTANFNGNDSFTYTLTDADEDAVTATVNITVNPVTDLNANNDTLTVDEDSTDNMGSVATNDSTTSGGTLTYALDADVTSGDLNFNTDGTYTLSLIHI